MKSGAVLTPAAQTHSLRKAQFHTLHAKKQLSSPEKLCGGLSESSDVYNHSGLGVTPSWATQGNKFSSVYKT